MHHSDNKHAVRLGFIDGEVVALDENARGWTHSGPAAPMLGCPAASSAECMMR